MPNPNLAFDHVHLVRAPDGVSIELLDRKDWPWRGRSE